MALGPILVMKLNSMKPAKSSTPESVPPTWSDSVASSKPTAQPMKPRILKANAAHAVDQQHGKGYPHDQQYIDERCTLGGQDVALNEFGDVARLRDAGADDGGKDGGGEHSDAVGAEVL